jgi:hypothetical protein
MFRIAADREAGARLDRITDGGKGPVDPHGPNAALAPRVFARSAADMGEVFSQAYRNQSPLEADDLLAARNRQNRASDGA